MKFLSYINRDQTVNEYVTFDSAYRPDSPLLSGSCLEITPTETTLNTAFSVDNGEFGADSYIYSPSFQIKYNDLYKN